MSSRKYYREIIQNDQNYLQIIGDRVKYMTERVDNFLNSQDLREVVYLNKSALHATVLDYFVDIARLKEFENIEHANKNKITAYMSHWWLRRKPLQIKENVILNESLVYINELFITMLIIKDVVENNDSDIIDGIKEYKEWKKHLMYHLKYRQVTAHNLELIILSIKSGIAIGKNLK